MLFSLYLPSNLLREMNYTLRFTRPAEHLAEVKCETEAVAGQTLTFHLARWRPGRYERQHYDRNLADLKAWVNDEPLPCTQTSTHSWELTPAISGTLHMSWVFYADQPDAGGSYIDAQSIYLNPINLLLYQPGQEHLPCALTLELPPGYETGGALPGSGPKYLFEDLHHLFDTPFFAGNALQQHLFRVQDLDVYLWFSGECKPSWSLLEADIRAYTQTQLDLFGSFPGSEFHYLFLILPYAYRHGVEHQYSTVIALGPGIRLDSPKAYTSLLEIASHEFFHCWNVKSLRPADLLPYSYDKEVYSRLHYVTEGVTTYYGDLMLWKSRIWNVDQWLGSLNGELLAHYDMGGKDFISLEESSFQSWTNGYQKTGIPNRRISFYTKGYLAALIADIEIRKATGNAASLDDVMRHVYHSVVGAGRGYTREDYQQALEQVSGISFEAYFNDYISGTASLEPALRKVADYMGFALGHFPPADPAAAWWGLSVSDAGAAVKVENILPDSPAQEAGLSKGDIIIAVNGLQVEHNFAHLLRYFEHENGIELHVFRMSKLYALHISPIEQRSFTVPQFVRLSHLSPAQEQNLSAWQSLKRSVPHAP
ncbi:MAG: M61 family peptidase [Bacteroidetes bacterium]|nr:MAG: M61 family peptidase [Bacteroidota bacterium]